MEINNLVHKLTKIRIKGRLEALLTATEPASAADIAEALAGDGGSVVLIGRRLLDVGEAAAR